MMSIIRKFLLPFSLLYSLITLVRNKLYDRGLLESKSYSVPVICVGNLSVGGTGKTPMIEYLLNLLLPRYKSATLSRGYGRSSKGFFLLSGKESASVVGDEPLQFKVKFPQAFVAVDEKRQRGISRLISEVHPEVILLDDAFQHRKVKAGLNIMLTRYEELYVDDYVLPSGNLREPVSGAKRASIIVVTKCPKNLSLMEQHSVRKKLNLKSYQHLFFSYIGYGEQLIGAGGNIPVRDLGKLNFTLVTGIANPQPLLEFFQEIQPEFKHLKFSDHYNFKQEDLNLIQGEGMIVTTEKDYMRLKDSLHHPALYYLPIAFKLISASNALFDKLILEYVANKSDLDKVL